MNTTDLAGADEIVTGYVSFGPPNTIKKGNSSMADFWDRYVRAGREWAKWEHTLSDKEKVIWKKYAGNLSTTESTKHAGNNKLTKQNGGAWALWILLKVVYRQKEMMDKTVAITIQKQHRKTDLTKWPLNADRAHERPRFRSDLGSARRRTRRRKPGNKTGKKEANANVNAQRSTGDLTEARTGFLDDLRNTVAGVSAEKFLIEKLVEDSMHLKDANRNLSHKVSSMATRRR
ncbi:hypothetical protein CDV36_000946 [Fusarium kuroshium]|uniref:Uncharacterized protein n=1 Tax=Fusarium kuroshium TaxID=2010991 RepID=A0A3M2SP74_9HYPO|nr:hypothetical protein CDV36_000946 [Fusarium kuroshium]